jgi:hypothetical protein
MDYDCARKEYRMALQVEMTFKFQHDNPVVAHLCRKIACLVLEKAKAVARQTITSGNDDSSLDCTKSEQWKKDWLQYYVIISFGDLSFAKLKWGKAVAAYVRAFQIGNYHDHASSITTDVVPRPIFESILPHGQKKEELELPAVKESSEEGLVLQRVKAAIQHFQRWYVVLPWLLVMLVLLSVVVTCAHWMGLFESNQELVVNVVLEELIARLVSHPFSWVCSNQDDAWANENIIFVGEKLEE